MIFYLVSGTSAAPSCLVGTQADARKLARERGTSWEQHDVPTAKEGLMAYVNELRAGINAEMHREHEPEIVDSPPDVPIIPAPIMPARFKREEPRLWSSGPEIDLICDSIAELEGGPLGNISMAVACRFKELAK